MQNKSLLYGLIGFFAGGLLVSLAATVLQTPKAQISADQSSEMSMSQMTESLQGKTGDSYDKAFIDYMVEHHQSAVDMAKLSNKNAKHDEIKKLSSDIIAAQEKEISEMRQWQMDWNYSSMMNH